MSAQSDLFAPPPEPRVCGTCVVWNALPGDAEGGCSVAGGLVPAERPAADCPWWFGLHELRSPLYGRAASSRRSR